MSQQFQLQVPTLLIFPQFSNTTMMQGVDHLTVDIDLNLLVTGIADANRFGALVATEPRDLPFRKPVVAGNAIHYLDLVGIPGDRARNSQSRHARASS